MSNRLPDYDVFLSYDRHSAREARAILRELSAAGIRTFDPLAVEPETTLTSTVWSALAESAVLLVVAAGTRSEAAVFAQIGAAMAWAKPIYVVADEARRIELPLSSDRVQVFSHEQLDRVVDLIVEASKPLTDEERLVLARTYKELGVPVDQLTTRPAMLERLTQAFNRRTGRQHDSTRLLREMIRLRKHGRWPRLGLGVKRDVVVVPHVGGWAVRRSDRKRATSIHPTKADAVKAARRLAIKDLSSIVVMGMDGKMLSKDTYGRDQIPPKDLKG